MTQPRTKAGKALIDQLDSVIVNGREQLISIGPSVLLSHILAIESEAGAAPLDVERLAEALVVNGISDGDGLPLFDVAEPIAAEYARLSEGTDR